MFAEYISKIGSATESDIRFALSFFLLNRFNRKGKFRGTAGPAGKEAVYLAVGAAMNTILGDINLGILGHAGSAHFKKALGEDYFVSDHVPPETLQFAIDNARLIEAELNQLSADNRLCSILSGAAYNIGYARYVKAGGSRGIFSNHFLGYVRSLFSASYIDFNLKKASKIGELGSDILKPFDGLRYGLLRPFPRNPDERAYYEAVRQFAAEMAALEKQQQAEAAEKNRIRKEFEDGYPTAETIAEFLDAHKEGGEKAILALLRKKKAEREQRRINVEKKQDPNDPNNIFRMD